jgi:hypothetical protein
MQATETPVTDYGCAIQGGSPDLGREGASHGRRGRSRLDCEGADGAASGTDHPEPGRGIQREGSERLRAAIDKLRSLHDGDRGVIEIAACGRRAIPALRALLFEREPSGLYQPRCQAVKALAALEAYDVLIEYLKARDRGSRRAHRRGRGDQRGGPCLDGPARGANIRAAHVARGNPASAWRNRGARQVRESRGDPVSCRGTYRGREPAGGRSRAARFRLSRMPGVACRRDTTLAAGRARERLKLAAAQKRAPAAN